MKEEYRSLFKPIRINTLRLQNRIIAAPITPYPKAWPLCKAGLLVLGCGGIDYPKAWWDTPYLFSKYEKEKTRKKLYELKRGGSKVSLELIHMGLYNRSYHGEKVYGPCDTINEEGTNITALNEKQLIEIAEAFGRTAKDAKDFGFDMVMLHFAHGWLPAQFLSPVWNHRNDKYGGNFENRSRFPKMIVKAVREAVGEDFPIDLRISAIEWIENSISFEETKQFLVEIENDIDMVNLSAGTDMNKQGCIHMATTIFDSHAVNAKYAEELKTILKIPVAVVGGILTPDDASQIINSNEADMVTIGRALIADPKWIIKTMMGKENEIVPCLRCTYCLHWTTNREHVACSVNPRYLKEDLIPDKFEKVTNPKNVVVIGGGAAGMKAAIVASQRGHHVCLYEKNPMLGGVLEFCDYTKNKDELRRYRDYLKSQIEIHKINVNLNTCVTEEIIRSCNADVLILAIGSSPFIPKIKGVEHAELALQAYHHISDFHDEVIIIGGGSIGCELALEFAYQNKIVHIIEMTDKLHRQDNRSYDYAVDEQLAKYDALIHIYLEAEVKEIAANGVLLNDSRFLSGKVILACGMFPNNTDRFYGICNETYCIGDCNRIGKIRETSVEGTMIPYFL